MALVTPTLEVAGLTKELLNGRQAQAEANKAKRAQRRLNQAQQARQRRASVREAQVATANVEAKSASQGGGGSTAAGAIAYIGSQLSSNMSFLNSTSARSDSATNALSRAASLRSQGALAQSIGGFVSQNSSRIDNLFDSFSTD